MNISPLWCPLVGGQSERGGRSPWLVQARWCHPHSHFEDLSKRTSLWSPKLIWTQNAETWGEREGEEKGSLSSNSLSGMSPSITVIGISQIYIFFSNLHIFKHTGLPWGSWTFPQPFRIKIQPIFQGSVQIPLSSMKTSQNLLTHLLSQKWAHPLLTFHHTFSSFPFLWPCSPLSRSSPTYWPMNCRQGLHLSVISLWIPRIESGIACYLHQWPHGWRWEDGRNGGIMLCLDSCQGSPFLPLHTSYELSPWITKMLGSAISFFLIIQYPDQPHFLLPKLVDEDSGMPWSRRWFV